MPKFDGVKEAILALQGLDGSAQKRILEEISKSDPEMAAQLRQKLVSMEDLINLNPNMIRDLLSFISPSKLGITLKTCSPELVDHFKTNLSKNNQDDLLHGYQSLKKTVKEVHALQDELLEYVRKQIQAGTIVLNADDEYV